MRIVIGLAILFIATMAFSQDKIDATMSNSTELPYYEIPEAPAEFNATTVAARMIDGFGFRYYWGTEGLSAADGAYKPSETSRSILETMEHIYGLSRTTLNAVKGVPNKGGSALEDKSIAGLRKATLMNIKEASDLLRAANPADMDKMNIIFVRGDKTSEYPFWNALNGPLADAIWHVGQIVSFRRAAGNPLSGNISVFSGKVRN